MKINVLNYRFVIFIVYQDQSFSNMIGSLSRYFHLLIRE